MTGVYTITCRQCGEFHAYTDVTEANASLGALKDRAVEHDHSDLTIIKMDADRVPLCD